MPEVHPKAQVEQLLELLDPGGLYGAAGAHGVHIVSEVAFATLLYVPTGHCVHDVDPLAVEYAPAGHCVQDVDCGAAE